MKKILVALDASPFAGHVLEEAVKFARAFGASLVLLEVVRPPAERPPDAFSMDLEGLTNRLLDDAREALTNFAKDVPAGVPCSLDVRAGTPWRVICEVADERDVDLIVIGAHGHKLLDRVLGSTTSRVASHTERSTCIVRGAQRVRA